jgi:cystathionine beta-lyase/cystathionine gamma-synthase
MTEHFSTQAVHAGEDKRKPYGALTVPIVRTSTYTFRDSAEILDFMQRKAASDLPVRDEYGRYSNPTQSTAERKLAALEGGERALLFASGMCAITTTLATLLSSGDHLVMVSDCYHRTREFALTFLSRWGIETSLVPADQHTAIAEAIRPHTRLIFAETPTNPYLRVLDLPQIVSIAKQHGILTMVDSTFATPINLRPCSRYCSGALQPGKRSSPGWDRGGRISNKWGDQSVDRRGASCSRRQGHPLSTDQGGAVEQAPRRGGGLVDQEPRAAGRRWTGRGPVA